MAQRRKRPTNDGSDVVYRFSMSLALAHEPTEQLALFRRYAVELAPFTVGEGYRADYMRELSAQIDRSIAALTRAANSRA